MMMTKITLSIYYIVKAGYIIMFRYLLLLYWCMLKSWFIWKCKQNFNDDDDDDNPFIIIKKEKFGLNRSNEWMNEWWAKQWLFKVKKNVVKLDLFDCYLGLVVVVFSLSRMFIYEYFIESNKSSI